MKIPELPKLTKLFNEAQLTRLELQNEHEHIILEKKPAPSISQLPSTAQTPTSKPGPTPKLPSTTQVVKAPFIGTFYAAASPTESPFVKVGTQVQTGQVLGIIEAMKMMNEIKAPCAGTLAKVLVTNEANVEYDQELFVIAK
ncbi:acetyl-CoA carboxylase biotin carboxyl carrier protein [Liquorilactobacillus satsumensis]|uniref:acetyl-CoA carboxylase biotin carboxyl carrier protein n=1 Tax=Liquorilactobacillus satsumensis TaxID=259059 RepID=UPI001E47316A|nr:acetyl-CoA carboxylase biotin carboxyl carrier protein [Liquorilactobacillus satsumensis]MCC7667120.1 acetyl-CoA carboxylase, biotin carboxyl carrier protein [Liquorilactobacillus satsumensis]MCP9357713.1 acetyl-CoA carboxylase biotin carboxyl carrier protein [Liquorilactobacillus satsumensis]MCP9371521.1 acetyl-CoA carboxylase biotin carboxyl carrier protein [Liquorilactobacillus satsumensis]